MANKLELAESVLLESNKIFIEKFKNCPSYADNLSKLGVLYYLLKDFKRST